MTAFRRYILLCLIVLCVSAPLPACAQSHYINAEDQPAEVDDGNEAAPAGHMVVTSIQKCYAQLSHEEALDIETNFIRPYEECKKRLAIKLKKKNQLKAGQQKDTAAKKPKLSADGDNQADDTQLSDAQDTVPPISGGFYRVQKDPLPPGKKPLPDDNAPPAPAPSQPKITTYSFNR